MTCAIVLQPRDDCVVAKGEAACKQVTSATHMSSSPSRTCLRLYRHTHVFITVTHMPSSPSHSSTHCHTPPHQPQTLLQSTPTFSSLTRTTNACAGRGLTCKQICNCLAVQPVLQPAFCDSYSLWFCGGCLLQLHRTARFPLQVLVFRVWGLGFRV